MSFHDFSIKIEYANNIRKKGVELMADRIPTTPFTSNSSAFQSQIRSRNEPSEEQRRTQELAREVFSQEDIETERTNSRVEAHDTIETSREPLSMEQVMNSPPEEIARLTAAELIEVDRYLREQTKDLFDMIDSQTEDIADVWKTRLYALGQNPFIEQNKRHVHIISSFIDAIEKKNLSNGWGAIHQSYREIHDSHKKIRKNQKKQDEELKKAAQEYEDLAKRTHDLKHRIHALEHQNEQDPSSSSNSYDPFSAPVTDSTQPNLPTHEPPNNGNNHCLIVAIIISGMYLLYMGVSYVSNCLNNRSIFRGSSNDGGEL